MRRRDWLTVLFIATNDALGAEAVDHRASASRWAAARNGSRSPAGRSGSVTTCSRGHQQDVALEDRAVVEEADDVLVVEDESAPRRPRPRSRRTGSPASARASTYRAAGPSANLRSTLAVTVRVNRVVARVRVTGPHRRVIEQVQRSVPASKTPAPERAV